MSDRHTHDTILKLFQRLRAHGFGLGIAELLDALHAHDAGLINHGDQPDESLKQLLRLLWCNSPRDIWHLDTVWDEVAAELPLSRFDDASATTPPPSAKPLRIQDTERPPLKFQQDTASPLASAPEPELRPMPVQAPLMPVAGRQPAELHAYWPVSRRFMVYMWRYLRRPIADGPPDVLDIPATIDQTTRTGFFTGPVMRRRETNRAHLILMLDHKGSMMPFHRYLRDLVETALYENSIAAVEVYYFANAPVDTVFVNPNLSDPVPLRTVLEHIQPETGVLIVSDAGAARGYYDRLRVRQSRTFIWSLNRRTSHIAWLNPMPRERWLGTSAEVIANTQGLSMFQMDEHGFSEAIDTLRGLEA